MGEADRLADEGLRKLRRIDEALASSALLIIENRSSRIYRRPTAVMLAILSSLGIATLFALGAWSAGESERITTVVACVKDAPLLADTTCRDLQPRSMPTPSGTTSATAPPGSDAVARLNACAAASSAPGVSRSLRDRALAACAGLPATTGTP